MLPRLTALLPPLALLLAGCGSGTRVTTALPPEILPAIPPTVLADTPAALLAEIDSTTLAHDILALSDDTTEGRSPGTLGEDRTLRYIVGRMRAAGLVGAMPDGGFLQEVPLLGSTPTTTGNLVLTPQNGEPMTLTFVRDFIANTDLDTTEAALTDAELVFVGYGVTNPGEDWDDYKGVDVRGKVVVSFVNDPPATDDEPNRFQADTLTYNGRWTYKYEEARRRGARGVLLIHTGPTAGYPFTVLSNSAPREQIQLATPPDNPLHLKGWITQPVAERLFQASGTTLDAMFEAAARRDFQPRPLPVTASLAMAFRVRRFAGYNVIGKLEGTERPQEAIIYTAHHDHLGIDRNRLDAGQDGIYNGAVDNASGVAAVLALADAFGQVPRPARSLLFMTLTAEESGLLGANHYVRIPVLPLVHTIANLNLDALNLNGRTRDLVGIGAERSDLLGLMREAAAAENMVVVPDQEPNQGLFFRSDQLPFARSGVPAVFFNDGSDYIGRPAGYADERRQDYLTRRYHQPADEWDPATMPLGGLIQQTRVAARLGWGLADSALRPGWRATEAFATTRAEAERAAGLRP